MPLLLQSRQKSLLQWKIIKNDFHCSIDIGGIFRLELV